MKNKIIQPFLALSKDKFTIDTIEDLKRASYLQVGDVVEINGYYTADDGATHKRVISNSDDGSGVQLNNGLWANIVHNGEINVSWFGITNNSQEDNTELMNKIFNLPKIKNIIIDRMVFVNDTVNVKYSITSLNQRRYGENMYGFYNKVDSVNSILKIKNAGININNIYVRDFRNNPTSWTIDLRGVHSTVFEYNFVVGEGTGNSYFGLIYGNEDATSGDTFVSMIRNNRFSKASIFANGTDSYIEDNEIWSNERETSIYINADTQLIKGNQLVGGSDSFIKILKTAKYQQIFDNYFDGSYTEISTGHCIKIPSGVYLLNSNIQNNFAYQPNGGFIDCEGVIQTTNISNNNCNDTDSRDLGIAEMRIRTLENCNIIGNIFSRNENAPKTNAPRQNKPVLINISSLLGYSTISMNTVRKSELYTPSIINGDFVAFGNSTRLISGSNMSFLDGTGFSKVSFFDSGIIRNGKYMGIGNVNITDPVDINTLDNVNPSNFYGFASNRIANSNFTSATLLLRNKISDSYEQILLCKKDKMGIRIKENGVWTENFITFQSAIATLNTPYHVEKMKSEGVYADFVNYMDAEVEYKNALKEKEEANKLAYENRLDENMSYSEFMANRPMTLNVLIEPKASEKLLEFAKKYL